MSSRRRSRLIYSCLGLQRF